MRISVVNITFKLSLYELDTCLNVSEVTLLEYVIDTSSYSLMTFRIASQIFMLDHGDLLLSLKLVILLLRFYNNVFDYTMHAPPYISTPVSYFPAEFPCMLIHTWHQYFSISFYCTQIV